MEEGNGVWGEAAERWGQGPPPLQRSSPHLAGGAGDGNNVAVVAFNHAGQSCLDCPEVRDCVDLDARKGTMSRCV